MAKEPGTLEQLVSALAGVFRPLREHLEGGTTLELLAELGIAFPVGLAADPAFGDALKTIGQAAGKLPELVKSLAAALDGDDQVASLRIDFDLIQTTRDLVAALHTVASVIDAKKATFPGLTPAEVAAFAAALPRRLIDYVIIRQVEAAMPSIAAGLDFVGVFERTEQNVGSVDPLKPPFTMRALKLGAIRDFLESPGTVLETRYGWGAPGFDGRSLLQKLEKLALEIGFPALYSEAGGPTLDVLFLEVEPDADGLHVHLTTPLKAAPSFSTGTAEWSFELGNEVQAPVQSVLILKPDGSFTITSPSTPLQGKVFGTFRSKTVPGAEAFILIGEASKSRLEFRQFSLDANTLLTWNPATSTASGDAAAEAAITAGRLVIDLGGADGFIGTILSGASFAADFDVALGVARDGFHFRGSGALEVQIPVHIQLGAAELQSLTLRAGLGPKGIPVSLGASVTANLGPLAAVVEDVGLTATFGLAADYGGNLGPLEFDVGFKPPSGIGLSLDAGVVKGGGYLFFDFDRQEYAGVLELSFIEIVTAKAIGLITTRMPDGSKGFSLLLIITAEFGTGIQLGFGFTLLGLGGLLGVNRTMNLQPLMEGVRTGAINSIMFPDNPVANAPRIISDLRVVFPPYPDRFLIGPMAELGWGTPTLVRVSVGIIIEITGNIAILGVLKIALPAEDAPLIVIQANFAGAIEFDKQRLYFFAGLFESRIVFLTLEGELGLLVAWGSDANFVVSVGGFHPRFNPPPLPFPSPKRISVSILNTSLARIRTDTYFAVTSNTVQFGAHTEVMFDVGVARVDGHLGFDALFQFSPFHFVVEISGGVSLKVFGVGLFSIALDFSLEGPAPYRAHGTGSLSLLFFDVSADFDVTWGDTKDTTLPPVPVMPLLRGEFEKLENWIAELPANSNLLVSLRKLPETESVQVLHPLGTLRVSQRAVPLDLKIDKVGSQKPADANEYTLTAVAGLVKANDTDEQFAKAQFLDMTDAQKLSQRAFDPLHGGLLLSSGGQQLGAVKLAKRRVRYEQIIIDSNYLRFRRRFKRVASRFFDHLMRGSAITKSKLSNQYKRQLDPFQDKVKVREGGFTVALTADNTTYSAESTYFASESQANQFLREQVDAKPELHDALHVIPQYEAA
jgi:Family of unknown function (DUF6603)